MNNKTVKLYGQPGCVQCNLTESYLKRNSIEFTKIDVVEDDVAREYVLGLGYQSVPVVEVSDEHWYGFRPDKLASLIPA